MNKKNEYNLIMQKGEIYWALDKKKNPHPIVFLENKDEGSFYACVLSTKGHSDNVKMRQEHFYTHDMKGKEHSLQYNKTGGSFLIKRGFEKEIMDIDLSEGVVGQLTAEGIVFVEEEMKDATYTYIPKPIWRIK